MRIRPFQALPANRPPPKQQFVGASLFAFFSHAAVEPFAKGEPPDDVLAADLPEVRPFQAIWRRAVKRLRSPDAPGVAADADELFPIETQPAKIADVARFFFRGVPLGAIGGG